MDIAMEGRAAVCVALSDFTNGLPWKSWVFSVSSWQKKGQLHLELHEEKVIQHIKGNYGSFYLVIVIPPLEFCVQFWASQYGRDIDKVDLGNDEHTGACDIQGKVEKMCFFHPNKRGWIWCMEDYCCGWLSDPGRGEDRAQLFSEKHSGRTRGWDQKLEHGNSIPIPMRVVRWWWNRLPG